jgi:hypothetical protein
MDTYSSVPSFREAKLYGAPPCVFDKSVCAAGEKRLWNTGLEVPRFNTPDLTSSAFYGSFDTVSDLRNDRYFRQKLTRTVYYCQGDE